MLALTHVPSPRIGDGERTHVARVPINYERAVRQHDDYCRMLRRCGVQVRKLDCNKDLPDSVFIEDTAIVLDEVAVLASMGAESRRGEPAGIEPELRKYRRAVECVELPGYMEGGDVLQVGRKLVVGVSLRTNLAGIGALEAIVRRYGYAVTPIPVARCLHLKTACAALPDDTLLINPAWIEPLTLPGSDLVHIAETEPWAANILSIGNRVCCQAAHPRTAELIRQRGFDVELVDLSEFAKAEGGISCLSILLNDSAPVENGLQRM